MHASIHLCKPHHPFSTLLLKFLVCLHFVQAMAGNQKMQLLKSERRMFSSSDDNAVIKQVTATHAPDGREVEVRLILDVVEDVLKRSTPTIVVVELQSHTPFVILSELSDGVIIMFLTIKATVFIVIIIIVIFFFLIFPLFVPRFIIFFFLIVVFVVGQDFCY